MATRFMSLPPYRLLLAVIGLHWTAAVAGGATVYVDAAAPPGGNGQSWSTAFRFLQDGLAFASSPGNGVTEVRVGKGTYKPDRSAAFPNGSGDRNATFQMIEGVAIRGGYAGFGAANPDLRDLAQFTTILKGDLLDNDQPPAHAWEFPQNSAENSVHVVKGGAVSPASILDSVKITSGMAGPDDAPRGGGIYINGGSPRIINCIFSGNYAAFAGGGGAGIEGGGSPSFETCTFSSNRTVNGCCGSGGGGGVASISSNPTFINCSFDQNTFGTASAGGAMRFTGGSPALINCTFTSNGELSGFTGSGGAIRSENSSPVVSGCTFLGNRAEGGGAISVSGGSPIIQDCSFTGSSAEGGGAISLGTASSVVRRCSFLGNGAEAGGGIFVYGGPLRIDACRFHGNVGLLFAGGAIYNSSGTDTLITNCVFSDNFGISSYVVTGGALYNSGNLTAVNCAFDSNNAFAGGAVASESGSVQLDNCIIFHSTPSHFNITGGTFVVTYSDVQGGWPGVGNINADPLFVRLPHPGPDGNWATSDDDHGDLRVAPNSPALNAGSNAAIPSGITTDLLGHPRIQNSVVDMGAYEGPHCPADAAPMPLGDGSVNVNDLLLIINNWGGCAGGQCVGDIAPTGGDRVVNVNDLLLVISKWGACP